MDLRPRPPGAHSARVYYPRQGSCNTRRRRNMSSGYDGKLFILAFDHRGSFQKKWFELEGEPTEEDTRRISDAKHLIFEGLLHALDEGADAGSTGALVDEQFGAPSGVPSGAKERGLKLAMPVE